MVAGFGVLARVGVAVVLGLSTETGAVQFGEAAT